MALASEAPQGVALEAADAQAAMSKAQRSGYHVLAVDGSAASPRARTPWGARSRFPLLLFTQQLVALLEAGLNAVEALQTLQRKERDQGAARTLGAVLGGLSEGRALSDAIAVQEDAFPLIYVAAVRASERRGGLASALRRYAAYHAQLVALRRRIVAASIYPCLLLVVAALVALFLLGFVVPRFSGVLTQAGREAAGASRALMAAGDWVAAHGTLMTTMLVLAGLAALAVARLPQAQHAVLRALLHLPCCAGWARTMRAPGSIGRWS